MAGCRTAGCLSVAAGVSERRLEALKIAPQHDVIANIPTASSPDGRTHR